jgi:hypothetical protein
MKTLILVLILMILPYTGSMEAVYNTSIIEEEYLIELEEVVIKGSKFDRIDDLELLNDTFRVKVDSFLLDCKSQGIEVVVFETWRSNERQNYLKKKGLSKLSGGYSKHQHGKAVDVVPIINGKKTWKGKGVLQIWKKISKIGKDHGLISGADWRMRDYPHFELKE